MGLDPVADMIRAMEDEDGEIDEALLSHLLDTGEGPLVMKILSAAVSSPTDVFLEKITAHPLSLKETWSRNESPLFPAVRAESLPCIRFLLRQGFPPDDINPQGATPLSVAAQQGFCEGISLLLDSGGSVGFSAEGKNKPIHKAAARGHDDALSLLIERGADVNVAGQYQRRPIHCAADHGCISCIEILLDHGAEINIKDDEGQTPLHWAVGQKHEQTARLLMSKGADPQITDNSGETPVGSAVIIRAHKVLKALLECGASPDGASTSKASPLEQAVKGGDIQSIQLLLEHGVNCNRVDCQGDTLLHVAIHGGNEQIVELLLGNGARVDVRDSSGLTVMDMAERTGFSPVTHALTRGGVPLPIPLSETDIDVSALLDWIDPSCSQMLIAVLCHLERYYQEIMFEATRRDMAGVVTWLLLHGVDSCILNENGLTPLHVAAANCSNAVVMRLLGIGVDPNVPGRSGRSPITLIPRGAQGKLTRRIFEWLTQSSA